MLRDVGSVRGKEGGGAQPPLPHLTTDYCLKSDGGDYLRINFLESKLQIYICMFIVFARV